MVVKKENPEINLNNELLESLSLNERKILPLLKEKTVKSIAKKTELEEVAVLRALEFLSNKNLVKISSSSKKLVELGVNGILYKQKGLPERRLINLIAEKNTIPLNEAQKESELTDNEFQAALGALKKKALINLANGNIIFNGKKEEITRKTLEELFLEKLPKEFDKLEPEEKYAFESLKNRRNIIELATTNEVSFEVTELGKQATNDLKNFKSEDLIEVISPELITSGSWKGKKFRRYDIKSPVPQIYGAKRHFVNQARDYARKIWSELGFKEMTGTSAQIGFWNFDALFTAQDHPVREIHDTFYIKDIKGKLLSKEIVERVKKSHEQGVSGSKGWRYKWSEDEAKRVILRTHTTALSSKTLSTLNVKDLPQKFFAVGKCFRNETVDWSHGFEFNQTEGIVIDENATFANLLGYLKEFAKKMGYEKVKFQPSFFPYTEPSVEGYVWNEQKKQWIEVLAAGIFRPEVTEPLLGKPVPVLAWGPGFDRMMLGLYAINDMRELYKNDLDKIRKIKFWPN